MPREPKDLRGWIKATDYDLSKAIRIEASDSRGVCQCVTCPTKLQWNGGMQAGHFLPKSHSIRYVEWAIKCQCSVCNCTGNSHSAAYSRHKIEEVAQAYQRYMLNLYGQQAIDALRRLKSDSKTWTPEELRVMRVGYKARFKAAKEKRGL